MIKFSQSLLFSREKTPILPARSLFFKFLNNCQIIMLVQEANSEIGSSQSCHKGFKLMTFFSLICPVSPSSYSGNPFLSWNLPSDSGLQSIISLTFPELKERYLEKKEEMMACLFRETGGLSSPDAAGQRRGQFFDISCMHS